MSLREAECEVTLGNVESEKKALTPPGWEESPTPLLCHHMVSYRWVSCLPWASCLLASVGLGQWKVTAGG